MRDAAHAGATPEVLILCGPAAGNRLHGELRARVLGNENSTDVLANGADADQLNSANEQDCNDHRGPPLWSSCPYQFQKSETSSKHECQQGHNATQQRYHSQRKGRKSGGKFEPDFDRSQKVVVTISSKTGMMGR